MATTAGGAISRVFGVGVGVVLTPVLIRYLGAADFGALETLTSLAAWLALVQVGVAPSLLNRLSGRGPSDPRAAALFSTSFFMQLAIGIALVAAAVMIVLVVDVPAALNFPEAGVQHGNAIVLIAVVALALQLPTSLARTAYFAYQRGYVGTVWETVGSALTLLAVGGIVLAGGNLPAIAAGRTLAAPVVGMVSMLAVIRYWPRLRPRLAAVTLRTVRDLWSDGAQFTLLAIASLIITSTDNIVITRLEGPAAVTPYAVAWKLTQFGVMVVMTILDAAWPAYRDASHNRDFVWLRRIHRRIAILTFSLLAAWGTILAAFGALIARLWVGESAAPDTTLLGIMVLVMLAQGAVLSTGRLITALGAVKSNARIGLANAAINLPLSIALGHRFGVRGVAAGTLVGYLTTGWRVFPVARRELRRQEQRDSDSTDMG